MKNPFAKFYSAVWHIARPVILLFHPIEVTGKENLPEEPALFCANHSSAWDPVLLFCALKGEYPLRIMAKKQLFSIPAPRRSKSRRSWPEGPSFHTAQLIDAGHDPVGVFLVFLRRALAAGIGRGHGLADDDGHLLKELFWDADEYRQEVHAAADGHHGDAGLSRLPESVCQVL